MGFVLKQQGREFQLLDASNPVRNGLGVLAIWGESDTTLTAQVAEEFPSARIEKSADPVTGKLDYLAAEIPIQEIPILPTHAAKPPLFFRP